MQATGGILTNDDLESYSVRVDKALTGSYLGRKVYTSHAPTSGPVLLHMLNLLERYDLEGEGRTGLNTHRFVEIMKCEFLLQQPLQSFSHDRPVVGFAARFE